MKFTTKNVIKFYEVVNWLFTTDEIPARFIEQKSKLNSIVPYIVEQLWCNQRLSWYLNEHTNNLYNIPDPIEHLKLLKKLIRNYSITKYDLWQFIPTRGPDLIKEIEERDQLGENDAKEKLRLIQLLGANKDSYIKVNPTKKNTNLKADLEQVVQAVEHKKKQEAKEALSSDSNFLHELNQQVIDDLGLVLFDTTVLKKSNRVLYIFIDKENRKRYYTEGFSAQIYISKKDGVINNDYIEPKTEEFTKYIINNSSLYSKLKFMLNDNYKRLINGG